MKDAYGIVINVGDTIYVTQRIGRYSKTYRSIKGTVTEVSDSKVKFDYITPTTWKGPGGVLAKSWKQVPSQVVVAR